MVNKKPHYEVAAALIVKKGQILITKRPAGTHLAGLWEFPGGKKEEGETLMECLEREITEELGIRIRAEQFLCKVEHEYESKTISLHLFQCSAPDGEPVPIGCESLAWVKPEELDHYPMPPADEELIAMVRTLGRKRGVRSEPERDG